MGISTKEISEVIKERLKDFQASLVSTDVGRIVATVREFADALEDTGRLDALERLLKKTGLRP